MEVVSVADDRNGFIAVYAFYNNIHEYMTEEEKKQTFDFFNSNDSIPEYEIVRIWYQKSSDESEDGISRMIVGNSYTEKEVELKPVENSVVGAYIPIYMAQWIDKELHFKQLGVSMTREIELFKTGYGTIVGSGYDENGVGYIGDMTISPVVKSVSDKITRLKRDVGSEPFPGSLDPSGKYILSDYHVLYTTSKFTKDNMKASAAATKKKVEESGNDNHNHKSKRQVYLPTEGVTVYPEILVYTDYGMQFIDVNMFYQSLENPRISLRVTAIVIGTAPYDVPFLEKVTTKDNMVQDRQALIWMSKFFEEHEASFPRSMYDIAITMTERKLCKKSHTSNYCEEGTLGIAKVAANCVDGYGSGVTMVGIIHDQLDFHGIVPAAHEIAHIIGVTHDGQSRSSSPYCDTNDVDYNYIMSPNLYDVNLPFVWSNCSRETFTKYLAENNKKCLRKENMAFNGPPLINILPGQLTNAEQQCIHRGYSHACKVS
ncbi:uncharacterized protein [Chelonus insularis]|uniref:uncharacterized protein n=1 Tax=Chelonus insularis TaxID=460826 RepID=UPI00158BA6A3|nr:uncharacterized protein LOC118070194 [Chelonus insularis]